MQTAREFYADAFSSESLFGFKMIVSWSSTLILLWCLALSALIWRANTKGFENKFMSILLICEGVKASFLLSQGIVYIRRYEALQDILWHYTIDVFFTAQIVSVLLYLCIPIYYRLNRLSFMHRASFKKHAWYSAPILGIIIWILISSTPGFYVEDATWVTCEEGADEAKLDIWFGEEKQWMRDSVEDMGPCTSDFETVLTSQPSGLWIIVLCSPAVSLIALLFIRSSIKSHLEGENPDFSQSLTSRSLYIGFLGKVIGLLLWVGLTLFIFFLHGGQVTFVDETIWRYGESTGFERFKYFLWILGFAVTPVAIAFECLMFVHATLKDTVFGIDNNLRKTFRTAVFTGIGLVAFVIGSEAMESIVGYGMAGGVLVGVSLLVIRKPILGVLDKMSSKFIPSTHTPEEATYLEAYATAMEDMIITKEERNLLNTLASAYGLSDKIVKQLEEEYDSTLEEE